MCKAASLVVGILSAFLRERCALLEAEAILLGEVVPLVGVETDGVLPCPIIDALGGEGVDDVVDGLCGVWVGVDIDVGEIGGGAGSLGDGLVPCDVDVSGIGTGEHVRNVNAHLVVDGLEELLEGVVGNVEKDKSRLHACEDLGLGDMGLEEEIVDGIVEDLHALTEVGIDGIGDIEPHLVAVLEDALHGGVPCVVGLESLVDVELDEVAVERLVVLENLAGIDHGSLADVVDGAHGDVVEGAGTVDAGEGLLLEVLGEGESVEGAVGGEIVDSTFAVMLCDFN